jgi:cation:H+ antiporter
MWWQVVFLVAGLVLLIQGANWLVGGASALARGYGVSDLAIGLTVVAFGTSAPEMVVNVLASFQEYDTIVLSNVIGSNNFNLFIILGITGLITPIAVQSSTVWKEIPLSFLAAALVFLLVQPFGFEGIPRLNRMESLILLIFFVGFLVYVYRQLKGDDQAVDGPTERTSKGRSLLLIGLGLAGLVFGGRLIVSNAIQLATTMGVSEKIIGMTIVAAGTSLPELATSVVAAVRKNADLAVGNIIGSNIFNLLFIFALSGLIAPIDYAQSFDRDVLILGGGTALLFLAMFTGKRKKLDRWEAFLLLVGYISYLIFVVIRP